MIPTDMRYNIKGRWQPGHQCDSFHWSIIYSVIPALFIGTTTEGYRMTAGSPSRRQGVV